ncbi:F-box domain, Leucine-rich repeat domain, L domain-like protein [Artemisia annua]|uniref:F-box domain, Leucine-rich repeat domain, L domain-like protein n=1 Tax=Artemisia annua TaxID=35608 RepID=A0A2U1MWC6_ARTAN|nr:F-box domain, Leucine-rich repeat domain, L domain-like protein [Artemisia annua]
MDISVQWWRFYAILFLTSQMGHILNQLLEPNKTRMNVQGDRLSNLPDDLIHKNPFFCWHKTCCPNKCFVFSMEKCLQLNSVFAEWLVRRLSKGSWTVISHNVKQLTVSCLPDKSAFEFPLSLFSSQSLEHLTIAGHSCVSSVRLTSTWELTSLTTLHIEYIKFNDEVTAKDTGIFSKCANLKKLVLKGCSMKESNGVVICHPGLSDLTLEHGVFFYNVIHVVAPQLKNLTVSYWEGLHLISAPELVSLRFKGWQHEWLKFSSYGLCSLENVDLCIIVSSSYNPNKPDARTTFDQLQQLHSVKYLMLNVESFLLLSPLMELISSQPSPFVNLKSLKVYPLNFHAKVLETIPAEIKKYLLDGSPSATFTEVSCEEMRALTNAESALKCMAELGEMLEHEKANIEKWEMTNAESALSAQIVHGEAKTSDIISKLCHIEELLTELPASKRAQIETSFSRLCTEADIVMNFMKIQSEEKQSRLSIKFHELAMAAKPSF